MSMSSPSQGGTVLTAKAGPDAYPPSTAVVEAGPGAAEVAASEAAASAPLPPLEYAPTSGSRGQQFSNSCRKPLACCSLLRWEVLQEGEEFLVIDKPPDVRMDGIPPPAVSVENLVRHSRRELAESPLFFVHRLDYGALCIGLSSEFANRASNSWRRAGREKSYIAVVRGHVDLSALPFRAHLPSVDAPNKPVYKPVWSFLKAHQLQLKRRRERRALGRGGGAEVHPGAAVAAAVGDTAEGGGTASEETADLTEEEEKVLSLSCLRELKEDPSLAHVLRGYQELSDADKAQKMRDRNEECFRGAHGHADRGVFRLRQQQQQQQQQQQEEEEEQGKGADGEGETAGQSLNGGDEYEDRAGGSGGSGRAYVFASLVDDPKAFLVRFGTAEEPGKPCLTEIQVLERGYYNGEECTKVKLLLHTGKRHQLRLHTLKIGHPIVGDASYNNHAGATGGALAPRMCLHAHKLHIPLVSASQAHGQGDGSRGKKQKQKQNKKKKGQGQQSPSPNLTEAGAAQHRSEAEEEEAIVIHAEAPDPFPFVDGHLKLAGGNSSGSEQPSTEEKNPCSSTPA